MGAMEEAMKHLKVIAVLSIVAIVMGACVPAVAPTQAPAAPAPAQPEAAKAEPPKKCVVADVAFYSDFFMQTVRAGMEKAAAEMGCELTFAVSELDEAKEASIIDDLITKKVDAIMITPVSSDGSTAAIKKAHDAGIKIICWNTCVNDRSLVSSFIFTEGKNHGAQTGKAVAQYIKDELGGKAKMSMLNCEIYELCVDRKNGFFDELKDVQVEVVANQQGFVADEAVPVAEAMIQAHPEVDLIWVENEGGTTAAVQAVKTLGKAGKLPVWGLDLNKQMAQMLLSDDNILQGTTAQSPYELGYITMKTTKDVLDGKPVDEITYSPAVYFGREDPAKVQQWIDTEGQAFFK